MSTHDYTLTASGPTGARSFAMIAAAITAICVLSGTPVIRELVGAPVARATTAATAGTWALQPRWWPGEIPEVVRPAVTVPDPQAATVPVRQASTMPAPQASTVPESDLTFAKGYQLRLASRQAASAPGLGTGGPSSESQFGRSAIVVRTAGTLARTDAAPNLRRVAAAHFDALVDRPGSPDVGSHALAYGEQRPSQRSFAAPRGGPFGSLFGNLY